jgi:hypothetical protein
LVAGGLVGRYVTYNEQVAECCDFNGDSVYIEFAYETNPADVATISQPDYPVRAAELVAQGLAQTFGFAYAPPVQPDSRPDWLINLAPLPAPLTGTLAAPVDVVNTVTNAVVTQLPTGTTLTVAYATKAHGNDYYMTQWSKDHETGYGILKSAVTLQPAPAPLPVYAAVGHGKEDVTIATDTDLAKVRIAAIAWLDANRGSAATITKDGSPLLTLDPIPADPTADPPPAPPPPAPVPAPPPAPLPAPLPEPLTGFAAFEHAIVDFADRELIRVLELVVKEFDRRGSS